MRRSEIPSLDDLRAFETTARLGSVRVAADSLALTDGAVSRRITKLSKDLGFKLFEKADAACASWPPERCSTSRSAGSSPSRRQRWRASALSTVGRMPWFSHDLRSLRVADSRSQAFRSPTPIRSDPSVGGGPVEFRRHRIDLAIRRLDFALPEAWHVRRLFPEKEGPVMSPQLAPAFASGEYIALGSKTRPDAWSRWLSNHPSVRRPTEIRFYDHHSLIVEAASAGLGVALSPRVLATDDIERGRLIAPAGFEPDESHYGLIWTGQPELSGKHRSCSLAARTVQFHLV